MKFSEHSLQTGLPDTDTDFDLPGLISTVEITRDKYGIPHVKAKNVKYVFFGVAVCSLVIVNNYENAKQNLKYHSFFKNLNSYVYCVHIMCFFSPLKKRTIWLFFAVWGA